MPYPSFSNRTEVGGRSNVTEREFDGVYFQLEEWLSKEHKADGTHGAVTADSITVSGAITIGGSVTLSGPVSIAKALSVAGQTTLAGMSATSVVDSGNMTVGGVITATGVGPHIFQATLVVQTGGGSAQAFAVANDGTLGPYHFVVTADGSVQADGTLGVTGNLAVNTSKFKVTASSGKTEIAGDVLVNTNKFTVDGSNGNTTQAGSLAISNSQNSGLSETITNGNTGASAFCGTNCDADKAEIAVRSYGSGFTAFTHGGITLTQWCEVWADTLAGTGPQGLLIGIGTNKPIVFASNGTEAARMTSSGIILPNDVSLFGTTTGAAVKGLIKVNASNQCEINQLSLDVVMGGTAVRWTGYGAGALTTDGSGNITAVSDSRLKTDVRPLRRGLDTVLALRPVLFKWNEESKLEQRQDYCGFIAQEVREVLPETVGMQPDGYLTLADRGIIGALVNAIKELTARVRELEEAALHS